MFLRPLRSKSPIHSSTVVCDRVHADGLARQLGLADGDVLVSLAGAPIASLDDLVTVLRVLLTAGTTPGAAWVRSGTLMTTPVADRGTTDLR